MSEAPKIVYRPAPGATPEDEVRALTAAYRLLLDSHERKKAAHTSRPGNDPEGDYDARTVEGIVPE